MKISDVKAHVLAIPIKQEELPTPWIWGAFNQIIVEIQTDEGLTGYGEAYGYGTPRATAAVIDEVLKPMLLGEDPSQIAALHDRMYRQTHLFGRYGITTFAISGIDIALWDIAGKAAGVPLHRLLGSAITSQVEAYASLVRYPEPEQVRVVALHAKEAGYTAVKLHQLDVESIRVSREAVGSEIRLMMDINCAWTPEQALDMARRLAPYALFWLEEPLWPPEDFKGLARLAELSGVPVATGENACTVYQFQAMLEARAASYIQPSVIKVGGISEWRKIAALAETYNVTIAPHSPYFGPGLSATAHLVAAAPRVGLLECLYVALEASVFKEPPRIEEGHFLLPQGPGLGLEIDPEVLARYRKQGD
ncbi:MAG: mandelate racemase/muconate lactonizing enzyme family protein [Candidatus Methylomirabilia bacterium]